MLCFNIIAYPKWCYQPLAGDVTERFHCVFWLGDLNFRLEKERHKVDNKIKGIESEEIPNYEDLMQYDELFRVRNEGKVTMLLRTKAIKVQRKIHVQSTV